jgi:hypothetical protein
VRIDPFTSVKLQAMISDNLINRLPKDRVYSVGISGKDLEGLSLTSDLKADILACLNSANLTDVKYGFFFAEQFLKPGRDPQFDKDLLSVSLKLLDSEQAHVMPNCILMLILLGQKLCNYRELMLRALQDNNPLVREKALFAYETFAKPREFIPLEQFENDDYATEIGMGSHLVFALRNQALETIERVIARNFSKHEKAELYKSGVMAFWWDWTPFHKWKNGFWRKLMT